MTMEEKIGALSTNPSVPRLGIAGTGHVEGLHGLALGFVVEPGAVEVRVGSSSDNIKLHQVVNIAP